MKGRKCLVVITLIILMLLQSIVPLSYVVSAATSVEITLNSKLYAAVKNSLQAQSISATYDDSSRKITITDSALSSVTYLDLSNSSIDDLTGLSAFTSVSSLNLTANELTADSNLSELDSLPLTKLNLSSNKLESVSSITTFDSITEADITNQEVTSRKVVTVDITEESDHSLTYSIALPDILLKDGGIIDADWIDSEVTGDCSVNWSTVSGNNVQINVASGSGDSYKPLKGLVNVAVDVKDTESKLANTKMKLYYVVVDSDETGICFNDENLYNAVKSQLTKGQTENTNLKSYGTSGETLYLRAYDDALILVIDNDTLINKISSLKLNDKKLKDLTGLEQFVGLDSSLDLSYNYIDSFESIVELDTNKEAKEKELQDKYTKYASNLSGYRESLKKAQEEAAKLEEELENLMNADKPSETAIAAKTKELGLKATEVQTYRTLLTNSLAKLYKTWNREYLLTTFLTPETVTLTSDDISGTTLETAKTYAESIMDKISKLEDGDSLTDWESSLIIDEFDIPTQTTVTVGDKTSTVAIENPITSYFDTFKKGAELKTISDYQDFITRIKILDAIDTAGNYCLNERLFNGASSCSLATGFTKLIEDLTSFGYDTSFATQAKANYSNYTKTCMCGIIDTDSTNEIEEIISGKYANCSDLVSTFIRLPRLKKLNMQNNSVESLEGIENLPELESLNMYQNLLGDITNVDWSVFTKMTDLNLGYNQLKNVNCLEVIKTLENLNLSKNLLSGSFNFSLVGMTNLKSADFSNNQISDIAYFTNQFKFKAKSKGMKVEDYVLSSYCPTVKFQNQELSLSLTVTKTGDFITVDLPSIFEQAESIDYSRTSFGINSLYGTVEADGTTVKLYTPNTGKMAAEVTIDGYNGNAYSTDGIAYGTVCNISYIVTDSTENPVTPTDPDTPVTPDPVDPDPVTPDDPVSGDISYGYTVDDGYVYVGTPEISLSDFAYGLVKTDGYTIKVVNNDKAIDGKIATGAVATVTNSSGENVAILEVVVLGDVNGDGEVDALDSGIVRNVINDTTSLVGSYAEAADVNKDSDIDSLDALTILKYRADVISSFNK